MLRSTLLTAVAISTTLIAAPLAAAPNYEFKKQTASNAPKVSFKRLYAVERDGVLFIKGALKKRPITSYVRNGHIDIAVYDPSGELITETTTSYSSSLNLRKLQRTRGNRFTAPLAVIPPEGSTIKVAFHQDGYQERAKPSHKQNIAR